MLAENDTETNQTPATIRLPDRSEGVENPPEPPPPSKPDEHVPPIEVPGRQDTPEPIPEKGKTKPRAYPILVKHGPKTA